ncbi:hypothetical protein CEXT_85671 [Caerostris extrusa]|uniref:Uncharacterized protein n=1 Tax=Caerostris extrusa TaxID=172846 RepID=A0AAV4XJ61_CAEEX|nr:hypothetical protein CEXT_85671 [Caerostris extrusa]
MIPTRVPWHVITTKHCPGTLPRDLKSLSDLARASSKSSASSAASTAHAHSLQYFAALSIRCSPYSYADRYHGNGWKPGMRKSEKEGEGWKNVSIYTTLSPL